MKTKGFKQKYYWIYKYFPIFKITNTVRTFYIEKVVFFKSSEHILYGHSVHTFNNINNNNSLLNLFYDVAC